MTCTMSLLTSSASDTFLGTLVGTIVGILGGRYGADHTAIYRGGG